VINYKTPKGSRTKKRRYTMKERRNSFCIWLLIIFSVLSIQGFMIAGNALEISEQGPNAEQYHPEISLEVSPQDLYLDQEVISINIKEICIQ
jgi:hypothetical protein